MKFLRPIALFFVLFLFPSPIHSQDRAEKAAFRVSTSSKTLGYAPLWVAQKQGFFEKQGLTVELILMGSADKAAMALVGGSVYVSGGAADAPIGAIEQGIDLVIIGGVINGLSHMILGGKSYRSYEDLRGATIGSSGLTSGTAFVLRRVLKAKGLEYPRDYKLINVGGSGPSFAALTSGQIAATIIAAPLSFEAADMGYNVIGRVVDVIPKYQLSVLTVKRSWAEKNRPLVVRFMKAMVLANHWLYDDKQAAIDFLSKEMQLKPVYARKGWEYYTENHIWNRDSDVNIEGVRTVIDIMADQGQIKPPLPSPAKYVDQGYLSDALKQIDSK
jgi:ABC-type nitrate/sulfonate/bicarbonate transport system substrate-binding protein